MCEFCTKHGEGKKWYLNIKNYSLDLLSDLRRRKFIREFMSGTIVEGQKHVSRLEVQLARGKNIPQFVKQSDGRGTSRPKGAPGAHFLVWRAKSVHYGQVIPLEDVKRIFEMTTAIFRVACGCRWAAKRKEGRYCFPVSLGPPHWFDEMDVSSFGSSGRSQFEILTFEEAMEHVRALDGKGLVHSAWSFGTPFIGAVCNCDRGECLAMRTTVGLGLAMMFRAEYLAEVDMDRCTGCRECIRLCQFGAIGFSILGRKSFVDPGRCYGCGVCRSVCEKEAIRLIPRKFRRKAEGSRLSESRGVLGLAS